MAFDETPSVTDKYPPYVLTKAQRHRWDMAQQAAEEIGGPAELVWQATRSLYHSDIPTDDPVPSDE
jgi:predicted short-subunit dehydrogenase-like oxidoreductase (DUF2520 family)